MSKKKDQIGLFFMPKNGILGSIQLYISGFSVASQLLGFAQLHISGFSVASQLLGFTQLNGSGFSGTRQSVFLLA